MATQQRSRVLIAGGGVAALEAALTLREAGGDALDLTLVAPEELFLFRPLATAEAFALGHIGKLPLAAFARDIGARHEALAVTHVDAAHGRVRFGSGEEQEYDSLLVAVGAHAVPAIPSARTWWDETDPQVLSELVRGVREGEPRRLVFLVTPGCGWPLPLYELALMTARALTPAAAASADISIVTHEAAPLSLFGPRASAAVGAELEAAGIELRTGVRVDQEHTVGDEVFVRPGGARLEADEIVTLPRLEGPRLAGMPANRLGFLPIDAHGHVIGTENVWAAGDATAFPVKQCGLAAQQGEAAALSIAATAGLDVVPIPFDPVLRGTLLTNDDPSATRLGSGEPLASWRPLWWPPTRVAGRRLGPYLAARADGPIGLPVEIPVGAFAAAAGGEPDAPLQFGSRAASRP